MQLSDLIEAKSVAIVGNALSLFNCSYGQQIDSHDIVIRLNKAAMWYDRFDVPQSHGKRTDIWMFWSAHEYRPMITDLIKRNSNVVKVHCSTVMRHHGNVSMVDLLYPIKQHHQLCRAAKIDNPTTGLMAIDFCLSANPSTVSLYGFDWKATPTWTDPDRVYDQQCPHDHCAERLYCQQLAATDSRLVINHCV